MSTCDLMFTLLSSVISGLIGVIVSILYYKRYEKRQMKYKTLRDIAANRYDILGEEFTKSLNEIFVVYNDSSNVRNALKRFHENRIAGTQNNDLANQYLIELFKSMCDNIGIKYGEFTDNFFLRPFSTKRTNP